MENHIFSPKSAQELLTLLNSLDIATNDFLSWINQQRPNPQSYNAIVSSDVGEHIEDINFGSSTEEVTVLEKAGSCDVFLKPSFRYTAAEFIKQHAKHNQDAVGKKQILAAYLLKKKYNIPRNFFVKLTLCSMDISYAILDKLDFQKTNFSASTINRATFNHTILYVAEFTDVIGLIAYQLHKAKFRTILVDRNDERTRKIVKNAIRIKKIKIEINIFRKLRIEKIEEGQDNKVTNYNYYPI